MKKGRRFFVRPHKEKVWCYVLMVRAVKGYCGPELEAARASMDLNV